MKSFNFRGTLPASKSILNRLLILQSYYPQLEIIGDSTCDDVQLMRKALSDLNEGLALDCGSAGTTFRFLALRVSRIPGQNFLRASSRLLERPHEELFELLRELQVEVETEPEGILITTSGWRPKDLTGNEITVEIDCTRSSQFASGFLLNCWDLRFDVKLSLKGAAVSTGYFEMTRQLVEQAGMQVRKLSDREYLIPANQALTATQMIAEPDISSAFAIAAHAAVAGKAELQLFPSTSAQPDFAFIEILRNMNAKVEFSDGSLIIENPAEGLKAVEVNLGGSPDLFPVLSVLCALAEGTSNLHGAPQLIHKESNRIEKTAELVRRMGRKVETHSDGMVIHGSSEMNFPWRAKFDPDQDHRLAMAASIAQMAGAKIEILHPEVVSKSYPEFWDVINASLTEART